MESEAYQGLSLSEVQQKIRCEHEADSPGTVFTQQDANVRLCWIGGYIPAIAEARRVAHDAARAARAAHDGQ